ncbi:MAG: hypothetical protein IJ328_04780 [Muribaculaceae bacterium]|nr:hypothetical protein [Muribaculaceae bacterium]
MKIKFYMLMMALFALSAVSCSDEKDEPAEKPAEKVAGIYDGYTLASCNYFSNSVTAKEQVKIAATGDATVNITFTSDTWGTFTISDATVTIDADSYSIKGDGITKMGHQGVEKEYDCSFEGVVQVSSSSAVFTFSVPSVMGGLTIEFIKGEIPADLVVAGTYSGYSKAVAQYFPDGMYTDDQVIAVESNGDGTYKVDYVSDTWGTFTIAKASLVVENDLYTLTGVGVTKMGMNGTTNDYECELTAVIDIFKEDPKFTFSVPAVMGGLTIEFSTGDMPVTE